MTKNALTFIVEYLSETLEELEMKRHCLSEVIDNVSDEKFLELRSMKHLKILKCKELNENLVTRLMAHLPDLKINEEINLHECYDRKRTYLWDIKPTKLSLFKCKCLSSV